MGNCIGIAFALSPNDKKVSPEEEDQELKASAMVGGKISLCPCSGWETVPVSHLRRGPLPLAAALKSGDICRVIPQLIQQDSLQMTDSRNGQRVKIVVNKNQLQLLIRSVEELRLRHVVIKLTGKRGKKWKPSLAAIPEL